MRFHHQFLFISALVGIMQIPETFATPFLGIHIHNATPQCASVHQDVLDRTHPDKGPFVPMAVRGKNDFWSTDDQVKGVIVKAKEKDQMLISNQGGYNAVNHNYIRIYYEEKDDTGKIVKKDTGWRWLDKYGTCIIYIDYLKMTDIKFFWQK